MAVDSLIDAPAEEKMTAFKVAEGVRWIEIGTNSIFRILQGTVAVIFGVVILRSKILSQWIGGTGVVMGAPLLFMLA